MRGNLRKLTFGVFLWRSPHTTFPLLGKNSNHLNFLRACCCYNINNKPNHFSSSSSSSPSPMSSPSPNQHQHHHQQQQPHRQYGHPLESLVSPPPSDIAISQAVHPLRIQELAEDRLGLSWDDYLPYGHHMAKICVPQVMNKLQHEPNGRYVVVTGISPTPLGEGKSTTTIGITQAIGAHLKRPVFACLRQPSQGPIFGIKGGAAGGGYSQIVPMEQFNLHMTGDVHALTAANNLLAAAIDTRMFHESTQKDEALYDRLVPRDEKTGRRRPFARGMLCRLRRLGIEKTDPEELTAEERRRFARLDIDPQSVQWRRVLDVNDRVLRKVTVGQSPTELGRTRETGFDISVASECMAILALARDLKDMRERMGRIVFGSDRQGNPLTAEELGVAGAMTALMKDAILPTLMQTIEQTPVLIHAGPFANIAHGNSSIVADYVALKLVGKDGIVMTEAGFGADIGGEKFFNIKCRTSGLHPDCAVLVASVRALKLNGGCKLQDTGKPDVETLRKGCVNMAQHIENIGKFGVPVVVCINRFPTDTDEEVALVREEAIKSGAFDAVESNHWAQGGLGAVDVGKAIIRACEEGDSSKFQSLYPLEGTSIREKMETIAREIYRADGVDFTDTALQQMETFTRQGLDKLPICVAKTQYSFTDNASLLGAPRGFRVTIKELRAYAGAGLMVALCGPISTIPGLPTRPAYYDIDIDTETGQVEGLF